MTTTEQTVTLLNSRKLSSYKLLIVTVYDSNIRNPAIFPILEFQTKSVEIDYSNTTTTRWGLVKYYSDTQVKVVGGGFGSGSTIYLIGLY